MKISHRFATLVLPLGLALGAVPAVYAAQPDQQGGGTSSPFQKDELFNGTEKFAKDASNVTEINQGPEDLNRVNGKNRGRARSTVLSVVRTYSYDKPGMYNIRDVEEFRQRLNTGDWHCSVHTRDIKHGESTDICNRSRNDGMVESAIITVEPKELTFIHTIKHVDGDDDHGNRIIVVPPTPQTPPSPGAMLGPGLSVYPGMDAEALSAYTQSPAWAALEAQGPKMEAQAARLQAMEPLMEARMAGLQARMAAMSELNSARWEQWWQGSGPSDAVRLYRSHEGSSSSSSGSSHSSTSSDFHSDSPSK